MLTTDFVTGAPNWLDLGSPDTAATAEFYGSVFGWDFRAAGPEAGGYGFFQKDGRTVAA
ncbi:VOC family protein, partial [Streptomyces syringium]